MTILTVTEVRLGPGHGKEGKISGVSVYSDRAEIARTYRFTAAAGQTRVVVVGLPYTLDESSVRVEGRGNATIHDVTISQSNTTPPPPTTSPTLNALEDQREEVNIALSRSKKTLARLDRYLESRTEHYGGTQHAIPDDVGPLMDSYFAASEKYDAKVLALKRELRRIDKAVLEEYASLQTPAVGVNPSCPLEATIGLYADEEAEVEIILKYAIIGTASWKPLYEVRANTEAKESPVEITYKAVIIQDSGEDWTDVPITLETARPTFSLALPILPTWNLSVYAPPPPPPPPAPLRASLAAAPTGYVSLMQEIRETEGRTRDGEAHARQRQPAPPAPPSRRSVPMQFRPASVSSSGMNVNATFRVPGLITVPSDGAAHNVTIAKLKPDATLSWLAVPQVDTRVHLTTKMTNTSDYVLLQGPANVYVDGSFISKSTIPLVSPRESFTCALGLDPSIRLSMPPLTKKTSTSGLLTKVSSTATTQVISVYNTKNTAIENIRVLAHVPVSRDAQIAVKLLTPSLPPPTISVYQANQTSGVSSSSASFKALDEKSSILTEVFEGVTAQWYSGDEAGHEKGLNGTGEGCEEGKVQWNCALEAKGKVELALQWEVSAGKEVVVVGL